MKSTVKVMKKDFKQLEKDINIKFNLIIDHIKTKIEEIINRYKKKYSDYKEKKRKSLFYKLYAFIFTESQPVDYYSHSEQDFIHIVVKENRNKSGRVFDYIPGLGDYLQFVKHNLSDLGIVGKKNFSSYSVILQVRDSLNKKENSCVYIPTEHYNWIYQQI